MAKDIFDLSGRVIVITGGLGQLGHQFATCLLARGVRIAGATVVYRSGGNSDGD